MSERNPKLDPQPGDVLRKGECTRAVVEIEGNIISCLDRHLHGLYFMDCLPYLYQFRKWARGAEVLERGYEIERTRDG